MKAKIARRAALCCLAGAALLVVAGCSGGTGASSGSKEATSAPAGRMMSGAVVDVNVTPEAMASKPQPWVLTTPESAVRSYLAWTSYGYRIGNAQVANPTMIGYELVRTDAYVQYNIQQNRLIDQKLDSITFSKQSTGATSTLVPAKEKWTYRYVSIKDAGKTVGGPYTATYDTIYTVVKSDKGTWAVESVQAEPVGTVK